MIWKRGCTGKCSAHSSKLMIPARWTHFRDACLLSHSSDLLFFANFCLPFDGTRGTWVLRCSFRTFWGIRRTDNNIISSPDEIFRGIFVSIHFILSRYATTFPARWEVWILICPSPPAVHRHWAQRLKPTDVASFFITNMLFECSQASCALTGNLQNPSSQRKN